MVAFFIFRNRVFYPQMNADFRRLNFPLQTNGKSPQIPSEAKCLICSKKVGESNGFVRLTTGAMLFPDKERQCGGPSDKMNSIFSLWFHGPHPSRVLADDKIELLSLENAEYSMDIVEQINGGQVDLLFCSSSCLKKFFDEVVQSFDSGIASSGRDFKKIQEAHLKSGSK